MNEHSYWSSRHYHRDTILSELRTRRDFMIAFAHVDVSFFEFAKAYVYITHKLNCAANVPSVLPLCVDCYILNRYCPHLRFLPRRFRRRRPRAFGVYRRPNYNRVESPDSAIELPESPLFHQFRHTLNLLGIVRLLLLDPRCLPSSTPTPSHNTFLRIPHPREVHRQQSRVSPYDRRLRANRNPSTIYDPVFAAPGPSFTTSVPPPTLAPPSSPVSAASAPTSSHIPDLRQLLIDRILGQNGPPTLEANEPTVDPLVNELLNMKKE
ncbi:unnamed protein product [Orchesella dallaii]|uniref:Uncharacterized protein n=1 Tax=Orchesella dallaii TaxID=48710 RepID=A0ABP1R407_9HEXA